MWYRWFYKAPLIMILIGAILLLIGYVFMALWNVLIPDLFHGPLISFWQAVGLIVLIRILFHHHCGPWRGHHYHHQNWRRRFEEKLSKMSSEEREKFRADWRMKCSPRYWDRFHHADENDCYEDNQKKPE
jgi:hypothetical protein